mmetsp:Transcript_10586/g.29154  ORF Transcript_10586/g.29154 Transcript_10586/m.29154 type:complete len:259 (+) Transcript_10586:209-985(+)
MRHDLRIQTLPGVVLDNLRRRQHRPRHHVGQRPPIQVLYARPRRPGRLHRLHLLFHRLVHARPDLPLNRAVHHQPPRLVHLPSPHGARLDQHKALHPREQHVHAEYPPCIAILPVYIRERCPFPLFPIAGACQREPTLFEGHAVLFPLVSIQTVAHLPRAPPAGLCRPALRQALYVVQRGSDDPLVFQGVGHVHKVVSGGGGRRDAPWRPAHPTRERQCRRQIRRQAESWRHGVKRERKGSNTVVVVRPFKLERDEIT